MAKYILERVISGGQTGVDQLGLEVAKALGIPTGGTAPRGYLTERGPDEGLRDYGLTEHPSTDYDERTRANVRQSDGTVLFGDETVGGNKLTLDTCLEDGKPCLVNPTTEQLRNWLVDHQIRTLNVAGDRAGSLTAERMIQILQVLTESLTAVRS